MIQAAYIRHPMHIINIVKIGVDVIIRSCSTSINLLNLTLTDNCLTQFLVNHESYR
jgi:hypothetical protein